MLDLRNMADFKLVFIVGIIGLIITMILSPKINILNLGDDVAIGLGESPEKIRFITLMVMIPMIAAAVAVGKNIAFVGLIIPQVVRKILVKTALMLVQCSLFMMIREGLLSTMTDLWKPAGIS